MSELFLGIDGGGTKTGFVCIDAAGTQRAAVTLGTTYHLEVGVAEAARRLRQGVRQVVESLGVDEERLAFVFFGLPAYGEDRVADPQLVDACRAILGHDRFRCGNDMVCGWAGSLGAQDGINLVAGTGSIAYGERQGRSARVGGWGELLGDEGSAYWIALQGLAAFSHMSDGRAPRGLLYDGVRAALGVRDDLELLERVMGPHAMSRAELAALAPVVSEAAAAGDPAAVSILGRAATHLFAHAQALRTLLGYEVGETTAISGSGSIIDKVAPVRHHLLALLDKAGNFAWIEPRHTPGYGAALYARRLAQSVSTILPPPPCSSRS